jgi:signal peptide peptidase SppA
MEIARESIFVSAVRSFCKLFFGAIGLLVALLVFSILYSTVSPSSLIEEKTTLHLLPDANDKRELVSTSSPVILQIPIHGIIGDPQNVHAESINDILIDSRTGDLSHERVKGILLHFNTPGGTVVDSDDIYSALKEYKDRYKVPIFAYVDGLCASGGMYIASAADQIFAGPSAIVGSVGVVIGPFFNFYDLMGKIGVQARTLTQGIDKDMMNPTRPWKEGEDTVFNTIAAFSYRRFVDIVTEARPRLNKTKLVQEYGAKIFDCVEAQQLGYIDHAMSSRNQALLALLKEAKIDPDKPYQVVSLAPKADWLSSIVSGKSPLISGKIEHALLGQPSIRTQPCYLYQEN